MKEALLVGIGLLLCVAVFSYGCSDRKTNNTYITAPSPDVTPDTVCVDKHGRPCKPRGGKH